MFHTDLTRLSIVNAEYYAYHGVKEEEKKLGGKYEVDLDLYYDAKTAIVNDDVKYSVNYEEALFCVSEIITGSENYNLVETLCSDILNMLMDKFDNLEMANVRIRKMSVPMRRVVGFIEAEQSISRIQPNQDEE
ncbi:MAG: dihydroneopterin aldolase [Candidatus Kapabacteria bacterium]|nr:dihydroneopterin aldolase [Ignavibacteriota bacterium]MCW5883593.1 dihydroneopterin aldolase [Candidatus Kapabacteria bacterium]